MTNQVAETIRSQIGHQALYLLGAKNLLGHTANEDHLGALSFRIRGSRKANYVKVTLKADDTYTIEFGKVRKFEYKVTAEEVGIYNDMLHASIERNTGLVTTL